jgi:hypothetical protein
MLSQEGSSARGTLPPVTATLGTALLLGALADYVLRTQSPGAGIAVFFVALCLAIRWICRKAGLALGREAQVCLGVGMLFAAGLAWRDAGPLWFLAFVVASAAFAAPALERGKAWLLRGSVGDYLEAAFGAVVSAATGTLRLVLGAPQELLPRPAVTSRVGGVLKGVLIATPLLIVFGALFVSADRLFADAMSDLLRVDLEELASHIVVTLVITWLAAGYFAGFVRGTRLPEVRRLIAFREGEGGPSLGLIEVGTALALVDVLFLTFVAFQVRYLFGGADLVEVTPGLTYAEYAREGFAQLALASALVIPSLLAADFLLRRENPRASAIFGLLGGLQLLLLAVILASAAQRLRVYQTAFGLTESRFFGAAFLIWLFALTLIFAATVLRGDRPKFAPAAVLSALALVVGLFAVNPQERIVRASLARLEAPVAGAAASAPDGEYLASLGGDAAPALIAGLGALPPLARCQVAESLIGRWGPEQETDWRSWNWSASRARGEVRAHLAELQAALAPAPCR